MQKGYLLGGLAAALLVIASHSSLGPESLDQTYTYSVAAPPASYSYSTQATADAGSYTYTMQAPAASTTFTYNAQSGTDATGPYTYTGVVPNDAGKLYTYNVASQAQESGPAVYTAQPLQPFMTVINGYAQEPAKKQEEWYTIPIGTLHPTDRAGDWQSGAFDSVNKDGTVAANAPLTLSGTADRPDEAQPTDPTDHVGKRASVHYSVPHSKQQQLRAVAGGAESSKMQLWNVPLSKVSSLPKGEQMMWAKHVVEESDQRRLLETPLAAVHLLSPSDQVKWARAVVKNKGKLRQAHAQEHHEWAMHVLKLLHAEPASTSAQVGNVATESQQAATSALARPVHARASRGYLNVQPRARAHAATAKADEFGMPELVWPGEGKGLISGSKVLDLRSRRGCGAVCLKQARLLAANALPTD